MAEKRWASTGYFITCDSEAEADAVLRLITEVRGLVDHNTLPPDRDDAELWCDAVAGLAHKAGAVNECRICRMRTLLEKIEVQP